MGNLIFDQILKNNMARICVTRVTTWKVSFTRQCVRGACDLQAAHEVPPDSQNISSTISLEAS